MKNKANKKQKGKKSTIKAFILFIMIELIKFFLQKH